MLNELYVPFVYTIETSLGFYHDYVEHKDIPFSLSKWEENGEVVVLALKEYYEELEQYDLFL